MSCGDSGLSCPAHHPHFDPSTVQKIQEVILWRSKAAVAITFVITELIFVFIGAANLGFFATIFFLHIVHSIFRIAFKFVGSVLNPLLFRATYDDAPDQSNRIRSFDEVNELVHKCHDRGRAAVQWLRDYRADPTIEKHFFFFFTLFFFFVISTSLGTFWVFFLMVHAVLIIPGAVLNPGLREFAAKKIRNIREAAEKAKDEAKAKQQ
jgi:hypothetical protein